MRTARLLVPLALLWLCGPLPAQEQPAAPNDLSALRGRTSINEEDRNRIRTFINERITRITGDDKVAARTAGDELRTAYQGSDAFKEAFAAAALESIQSVYKKADLVAATRLLTIANGFGTAAALPMLLEALQDERVGVRAAAAVGLRTLRPQIAAAGRDTFQRVLEALKSVGRQEKSRQTLALIYAAADYAGIQGTPDPRLAVTTVLDILDARAAQFSGESIPALGADDAGLEVVRRSLRNLNEDERKRLIAALGTMLKSAIEQYTTPHGGRKLVEVEDGEASRALLTMRNGLERLVIVGEDLLKQLANIANQGPDVTGSMKNADTTGMKNQWSRWVEILSREVNRDFSLTELPPPEEKPAAGSP